MEGNINPHAIRSELLSIEWNSIRLGGPAYGIVKTTLHKSLPKGGGDSRGLVVVGGPGVVGWGWDLFNMKLTLSVQLLSLKLKMILATSLMYLLN